MSTETDDDRYVDISECPHRDAVCLVVQQHLTSRGIPLPEGSSSPLPNQNLQKQRKQDDQQGCCFGVGLEVIRHTELIDGASGCLVPVPRILHHMVVYLDNKEPLTQQGLFRKTGSLNRQKELRTCACKMSSFNNLECSAHDVANLMKHFFRELPDCLLTSELLPSFMAVVELYRGDQKELARSVLDVCLLLPEMFFTTLQYSMRFFRQVASHCESNRMDIDNLAVVLTPNLVRSTSTSCQSLTLQTLLVRTLIEQADNIGKISKSCATKARSLSAAVDRSRLVRQRLSLPRSSPAVSTRIVLGTCLDARLGEGFSPNPSVSVTPSDDMCIDISEDSDHEKLHPRKRRPSLNSLMSSIGQSFARLTTPRAHHASDPCLASADRTKDSRISPDVLSSNGRSRADQAEAASPDLRGTSPVKHGKYNVTAVDGSVQMTKQTSSKHLTGTNLRRVPVLVQHAPAATRKRKGVDADIADVVSPRKRQAMMQSMAQSDRAMKLSASCTSASRVQTRSAATTSSAQKTAPQRALRSAQKILTTNRRRSFSKKTSSENVQRLALKDVENAEPSRNVKELTGSDHVAGDQHAKALALLRQTADQSKEKQTRFRRRLSSNTRCRKSQSDNDDCVAHVYEVGRRLANHHGGLSASYDAPSHLADNDDDSQPATAPCATAAHLSSGVFTSFSMTTV